MIPLRGVDLVTRILANPVFLSAFSSWFIANHLSKMDSPAHIPMFLAIALPNSEHFNFFAPGSWR